MADFNWRVASQNTLRAYMSAAKDFETVTGIRINRADVESIAVYQASLEARGLSQNTVRSRLSAVSIVSGVKIQLPKRTQANSPILDDDQVRAFFRQIEKEDDRALMVRLLLTGHQPKVKAHWLSLSHDLTTQEITRKIKRYARLAGLNADQVNMRTLVRTGRELVRKYDTAYLMEHILPQPARRTVEWNPLHGLNRRRVQMKSV